MLSNLNIAHGMDVFVQSGNAQSLSLAKVEVIKTNHQRDID